MRERDWQLDMIRQLEGLVAVDQSFVKIEDNGFFA